MIDEMRVELEERSRERVSEDNIEVVSIVELE